MDLPFTLSRMARKFGRNPLDRLKGPIVEPVISDQKEPDLGKGVGRKAWCGRGLARLVNEAVEASRWRADEQEAGGRLPLDAEAVRDIAGAEGVITGAKCPALLANDDSDAAVDDVETLILGVVNVPRRVARQGQLFDDRDGAAAVISSA